MLDAIQDIIENKHEGVVPGSVHRGLPTDDAIWAKSRKYVRITMLRENGHQMGLIGKGIPGWWNRAGKSTTA